MGASPWHRESCRAGRNYMLAANIYTKYEDYDAIIAKIKDAIDKYFLIEAAVRLTLDTPLSNNEKAVIAIPFNDSRDMILTNFAHAIFQSMQGYYISADPRTSHFGMSNLILEGNDNSLVRREIEKLLYKFQTREDMAGRCLKNIHFISTGAPEKIGDSYFIDTVQDGMDIHIGYRISTVGKQIASQSIFIPITAGKEVIEQVYYNLEQILHHNFATYDENADTNLKVTDTLVFKEIGSILNRAKNKQNTRKKLINNLQFTTVFTDDPKLLYSAVAGDQFYDPLNRVYEETIKQASDRSRELYVSCMLRATEITSSSVDINSLGLVQKTIVPSKPAVEKVEETVTVPASSPKTEITSGLSLKKDAFEEL